MKASTQVKDEGRTAQEKLSSDQVNVPERLDTPTRSFAESRRLDFILIALTAGLVIGLIFQAPPFFGPNDLSRWSTIYSLGEQGTYIIDRTAFPTTIDRVQLRGHFYSEKPPLLPTLLAGEYLLLKN